MSRVKVVTPETAQVSTTIKVRVGDLNYGNHLANDKLLGIIHQARIDLISALSDGKGNEKDFFGAALIMSDVAISYLKEAFLNDELTIDMSLANPTKAGFDMYYHVRRGNDSIAKVKTGMVCYDYQEKRVCPLPIPLKNLMSEEKACIIIK